MTQTDRIPGVLTAERFGDGPPKVLIEVPHGADEQHHYDALRSQLQGTFPDRLEKFFWVNTDVGAYALARAVAELSTMPTLVLRCEIPRTFIDVNRRIDRQGTGMTPGLQPYVRHAADRHLLLDLHHRYTEAVEAAYESTDGLALIPHTYAPRSVPIATIDDAIVENLERVYVPEVLATAPLRAEVDVITVTPEGVDLAPPGVGPALVAALKGIGVEAESNGTYNLHPASMGRVWSERWPGRILCFEVRRDLITAWNPFGPKPLRNDQVQAIAQQIIHSLG